MYFLFEMIYDCLFERSDSALNHFEMIYVLSLWNDISKETVFCTPLACSECLPIESWPNSIGKHPAEKESVNPFEMIYEFHFEMSDSDHNRFEMTNDYPFKMSNTVLCSFRYDIWLSFQNDGKIFVSKTIFVTEHIWNSRDENTPEISIFAQRFFRSALSLHCVKIKKL